MFHDENQKIPLFLYGTAWKEDQSARLTYEALCQGFVGIDTANQRRHYDEKGVGQGFRKFCQEKDKQREDIFLQTKFTYLRGQDHRLPYDKDAQISTQVKQSFEGSLEHFGTDFLDSFILHGPFSGYGLAPEDVEAWQVMEALAREKRIRFIGVSNFHLDQLIELTEKASVKPKFLQNRCFARFGWDKEIRAYCREHEIIYQGFSLLTANGHELMQPEVLEIAKKYQKTISQVIFRFSLDLGMLPLTGTTNTEHMKEDLNILDFNLTPDEVATLEAIAFQ